MAAFMGAVDRLGAACCNHSECVCNEEPESFDAGAECCWLKYDRGRVSELTRSQAMCDL